MDRAEASHLWEQFCLDGDPTTFERLYKAYRSSTIRYCRAHIGDEEAAQEITDQLFTYLAIKRPPYHKNFESMLFYFARLRCANYRPPQRPELLPACADGAPSALSVLETNEQHEAIRRALDQLPPEQQEVVRLHFLQSLPLSESARIMGIARWKAKLLRQKALRQLRQILKKTEI